MLHDEPSHRPGQDPNGYLPAHLWGDHYRAQIAHYEELTKQHPDVDAFQEQLGKYREWARANEGAEQSALDDNSDIPW
jgi:hypothetical protein